MMAEMLSFLGSKSKSYILKELHTVAFPDENYAREIMQLFSIGIHMLNLDGTHVLSADGKSIPTYGNSDIQNYARAWTAFTAQPTRSNIEMNWYEPNRMDVMKVIGPYRDPFPKMDLFGGHIGDNYPLCIDRPEKAFLRKGAKYRLIGSSKTPTAHYQPEWWVNHSPPTVLSLTTSSALYGALCGGPVGSCNFQNIVTLDSNIGCDSGECSVDDVRLVQVQSNPPVLYEYIRLPCVELAFYENGKTVQQERLLQQQWPKTGMCANSNLPVAKDACCWYPGPTNTNPDATSLCEFTAERSTFATAQARCNSAASVPGQRGMCLWNRLNSQPNPMCHLSSETEDWYWTADDTCTLQAKSKYSFEEETSHYNLHDLPLLC